MFSAQGGILRPYEVMQITASVTFLPLLSDRCSFDLLVYTDAESAVPMEWCATSFQIMTTDIPQCAKPILSAEQGLLLYQAVLNYTYSQRKCRNVTAGRFYSAGKSQMHESSSMRQM